MKYIICLPLIGIFILASTGIPIYCQSIEISDCKAYNSSNGSSIDVKKSNQLPTEFNHLIFTIQSSNDIMYKLDGFETIWHNSNGITHNLSFTNLFGGTYKLLLKNRNSKNSIAFEFFIQPKFWQQWWFWLFSILVTSCFISAFLYTFLLYRFRQQTKLQRVRNDIASDLHDDVGATLSSISFFGEMMRSKVLKNAPPEEVLPLLEKLISTSKETIETMRGVVWTINPNNDTATDFFQKLNSFGKEMLATKNIEFNFEATGFENQKLPLDIQRNLFLFYKETINNIAKHSKATSVEVNIAPLSFGEGLGRSDASVRFDSTDNGIGFNPADLHEGHGLKSLRKRAEELQGNLEIISAQGQGTKIILTFPIN